MKFPYHGSIPITKGCVILRDDDGPTGKLGEERLFAYYEGVFYDLACLTSTPGVQKHMIEFSHDSSPFECDNDPYEATAKREIARQCAEDDGVKYAFDQYKVVESYVVQEEAFDCPHCNKQNLSNGRDCWLTGVIHNCEHCGKPVMME